MMSSLSTVISIDRRTSKLALLEAAQDAFVIALRRLRVLEEAASQLRAPLDLEHAHDLWAQVAQVREPGAPRRTASLAEEIRAARTVFQQTREVLRIAEMEAAIAA